MLKSLTDNLLRYLNARTAAFIMNLRPFRSALTCRAIVLILTFAFMFGPECLSGQIAPSNPCPLGSVSPPPDMVAWWSMNETSGTTVADRIGGDNNGTSHPDAIGPNGPASSAGELVGNSLHFTNGRYVEVSPNSNLDFGINFDFTIDAWIKTTMSTQTEPIIYKGANMNSGYSLSLQKIDNAYRMVFKIGGDPVLGPPITPGQWNFVAVIVDREKDRALFYVGVINGSLDGLSTEFHSNANATNAYPLLIGKMPPNPQTDIYIDELEIYKRALGKKEIAQIFYAGTKGKCWRIRRKSDRR